MSQVNTRAAVSPALIVAGGIGSRFGSALPKAYFPLRGASLLEHSIRSLAARIPLDRIVCAVHPAHLEHVYAALNAWRGIRVVESGHERAQTVLAGLKRMIEWFPESPGFLIHDACRPFVPAAMLDRVLAAASQGADCVVPVLELPDSLKRRAEGGLISAGDRSEFRAAQTPQYLSAWAATAAVNRFSSLSAEEARPYTDEAAMAEALGFKVTETQGAYECAKLTVFDDVSRLASIFDSLCPGVTPPRATAQGFDAHAFGPAPEAPADETRARTGFKFCGVFVPYDKIVKGHSDGDVALHALTDAVLGCVSALDIGRHFSDTDSRWKGADSSTFLKEALRIASALGYTPESADVTAVCQKPKLAPFISAARYRAAELLFGSSLYAARVNIKATTTDGLGFTGRGEGLFCSAIVTMVKKGGA